MVLNILLAIVGLIVGLGLGFVIAKSRHDKAINGAKISASSILENARKESETLKKEALLEALCKDLFLHIKDSINHLPHAHGLYQQSIYPVSVFGHLLQHLQQNENKILELLASDNNEIFLRYFRDHLNEFGQGYFIKKAQKAKTKLTDDFIINHISGSFVEMVLWWVKNGMKESPTEFDNYFHAVIEPII